MLEGIENLRKAAAHDSPMDELMFLEGVEHGYSSDGDTFLSLARHLEKELSEKYEPKEPPEVPVRTNLAVRLPGGESLTCTADSEDLSYLLSNGVYGSRFLEVRPMGAKKGFFGDGPLYVNLDQVVTVRILG